MYDTYRCSSSMWMLSFKEGMKSPKMENVNKNRWPLKKTKSTSNFFSSNSYPSPGVLYICVFKDSRRGIRNQKRFTSSFWFF